MDLLFTFIAIVLGLVSIPVMMGILNRMPAKCFCDYDEEPQECHQAPRFTLTQGITAGIYLVLVFVLLYWRFGFSLQWFLLCIHCLVLAMIALSDLRFSIIPDELLIADGICSVLIVVPDIVTAPSLRTVLFPLLGVLVGAGFILALNLLGRLFYHKDVLGMGDLKLLAVCGLVCGPSGILIAAFLGILCAGLFFAFAILLKRMKSDQFCPFGPFLILGVCLTLCFMPYIDTAFRWYLSLLS